MTRSSPWPILLPLLIIGGLGGLVGWQYYKQLPEKPPVLAAQQEAPAPAPAPAPPPPPASSAEPAVRFPVDTLTDPPEMPLPPPKIPASGVENQVSEALFALLGKDAVLSHLRLDAFPTKVVVTIDNLTQKHASTRYWPAEPTPDRFKALPAAKGAATLIDKDNAARYTPFVRLIESTDMQKAVRVYVRLYPRFQQAYEQLGYPNKYFNDRLVDVIDHLLATPSVTEPLRVRLPDVKGPYASTRPWVRYEFDDPALEDRSAGQKIMLRMGPDNTQRLKLKLIELRVLLTRGAVAR